MGTASIQPDTGDNNSIHDALDRFIFQSTLSSASFEVYF